MITPGRVARAEPVPLPPNNSARRQTRVAARVDVGLGNSVFIRGQGAGLSWDRGTPMICTDASTWIWATSPATERVVFKLLLNDILWAQGEDIILEPGEDIELVPAFMS